MQMLGFEGCDGAVSWESSWKEYTVALWCSIIEKKIVVTQRAGILHPELCPFWFLAQNLGFSLMAMVIFK